VVTFSAGTMASGGTFTASVTALVTEDGSTSDTATVSSNNPDPNAANNSASATTSFTEPAINVSGPIHTKNRKLTNFQVATFTHASGVEPASAFTATINWGDGTTSAGTIVLSGTTYSVKGTHTYTSGASHTITTSVSETAGQGGILVEGTPARRAGSEPSNAVNATLSEQWFALQRFERRGAAVGNNVPMTGSNFNIASVTGATSVTCASSRISELATTFATAGSRDTGSDLYFHLLGQFESQADSLFDNVVRLLHL
jgi:hypothetical protein